VVVTCHLMQVRCLLTGFAKLEYRPGDEFIGLFVRTCTAMQLEGFDPQALANVMNGEGT
jgi:hypothetical protein